MCYLLQFDLFEKKALFSIVISVLYTSEAIFMYAYIV